MSSLALVSKMLSSTTINGSAFPIMVDTPRKRIVVPEPRFPDEAIMSKPAMRPCKASSAEVKDKPSNSVILIVCWAKDCSRSGISNPPVAIFGRASTTTSFITLLFSSIMISKTTRFPISCKTVLYPI